MKRTIFLLLAFTLVPLIACQPAEKAKADSKIHFELAREYLMAGSPDKAVAEADAALKADSGNTAAAFLKADVLAKGGHHGEARQAVDEAAKKLGPQDEYLKDHWLGMLFFHKGEMDKALEHFNRSSAANPKFADNYSMIGQTCAKMGNTREAVAAYEKWTAVEPASERAWSQLGMARLGSHELDKAREALDKALAINPQSGLVHNYLGALAVELHQPKEAEEFFRKSVALDSQNQFAHLNLAQLLFMGGRHKDALPSLTKALEIQPDNQFALFYMGRYYQMEKDFGKAVDYYEKACAKDPNLWVARSGVAEAALAAKGMYDRAEKALNEGIIKDPPNQKGYYYFSARISLAKGDYTAALQQADKAAALLGKDDTLAQADSHLLRGLIFGAMNKSADAKKEFQAAAQLAPGTAIEKDAKKRLAR